VAFFFAATRGVLVVVAGIVQNVFSLLSEGKMFGDVFREASLRMCQSGFQGGDGEPLLLKSPLGRIKAAAADMAVSQRLELHATATHRTLCQVPFCLSAGRLVVLLAGGGRIVRSAGGAGHRSMLCINHQEK